jgi:cell division protein FtsN
VVQIGAFSSEALANKGWSDVAAAFPGDMSGKGRRVESVESNGATLYRGQVTGFASREAAAAFCAKLKAAGKSCIVK